MGARPTGRPSAGAPLFSHSFLDLVFVMILMDVGSSLASIFHNLCITSSSIDSALICHRFGDGVWYHFRCFCWYLFRSRTQPAEPSKTLVSTMSFKDFTIQRDMIFDDFHDLFRYQFWHSLLMTFGIDFGSILEAFRYQISWLWVIYFLLILGW